MIENKVPNPPAIMVAGLLVLQLLQPPDSGLDCDSGCCAAREFGGKRKNKLLASTNTRFLMFLKDGHVGL